MFSRSFRSTHDQTRIDKSARLKKSHARDQQKLSKLQRSFQNDNEPSTTRGSRSGRERHGSFSSPSSAVTVGGRPLAPSPIVTLTVGREGRLFAAHEDVLRQAPFFEAACRGLPIDAQGKRVSLPDEEPEVFSAVLEYLYKGDYYPRLLHDKRRNSWALEDAASNQESPYPSPRPETADGASSSTHYHRSPPGREGFHNTRRAAPSTSSAVEPTVYLSSHDDELLRDTVVYCAADRYGLEDLKLLALRKQGLQSGIDVGTILRSAAYAYAHTPDSDSRLRAHYLALIIRCRKTFKRSGTMQVAMEAGGTKLFFDLFVAMCNHLDDVMEVSHTRTPRTV